MSKKTLGLVTGPWLLSLLDSGTTVEYKSCGKQ